MIIKDRYGSSSSWDSQNALHLHLYVLQFSALSSYRGVPERGAHWLGQLNSSTPAFKLPVISFLCVNMCFLSGAWRPEGEKKKEKTCMKTALTSNYTEACPGDGLGWALVCWRSKRLYAPEREETMAAGRLWCDGFGLWVWFHLHSCVVE